MALNIIKVSLGRFLVLVFFSCTNGRHQKTDSNSISKIQKDTCQLDLGSAQSIELHVGCGNCHTYDAKRQFPQVPTFKEIADIDSLKLSNFIFKTRHNGYFLKDTILLNHNNKALDTLDECEKRNLVYFIKSNNRRIPQVLKVPKNDTVN
jgi:hypothetical protein